jgi:DNA-binding transcriptional LysR family regulator
MLLHQPSLSKHIKNLEDFTGCGLINRTKSGISLTAEGSILYGYAKRILRLRDEARDKILISKDAAAGIIFVAASTIPATYILPSVLTALKISRLRLWFTCLAETATALSTWCLTAMPR